MNKVRFLPTLCLEALFKLLNGEREPKQSTSFKELKNDATFIFFTWPKETISRAEDTQLRIQVDWGSQNPASRGQRRLPERLLQNPRSGPFGLTDAYCCTSLVRDSEHRQENNSCKLTILTQHTGLGGVWILIRAERSWRATTLRAIPKGSSIRIWLNYS